MPAQPPSQPERPPSPQSLRLQITYLLQALVVIVVTGLTMLVLAELLPFELEGRWFRQSEIYFLAIIANLVFFHTLAWHIVEESRRGVAAGTAVAMLVTSALMYATYYLFAIAGI